MWNVAKVVRDHNGWGVEWRGALMNQTPLPRRLARQIAGYLNAIMAGEVVNG